jgi:hypothetical protein
VRRIGCGESFDYPCSMRRRSARGNASGRCRNAFVSLNPAVAPSSEFPINSIHSCGWSVSSS